MNNMKTSELTGAALDWAVAKCEGTLHDDGSVSDYFQPSTDWSQGGKIIEREGIALYLYGDNKWNAMAEKECQGATPLVAAMRCYVASKLGDEVQLPEEITDEL